MLGRILAALFMLVAVPAAAGQPPATPPSSSMAQVLLDQTRTRLEKVADGVDGVMGYAIVDLTSGQRFGRLDTRIFPTASTIKLAILYELFKQAEEHRLTLDDQVRLDRTRAVPGGILYELGTPVLSLRDYANVMVIESDNTATNVLITTLGMDAVTARMAGLGLRETKLRRYMIDLDAARQGRENVSTPAEIARLLEIIHRGEGLSRASRDEAIAILEKPKESPVRRAVPGSVTIASKSGSLEGVRADTAIVYAKNRPFVFVAMTTWLEDDEAGDAAIQDLARVAYACFARMGAGSEYGRQIGRE